MLFRSVCWVLFVLFSASLMALLASEVGRAMQRAETNASVRLLSRFHIEYLESHGIPNESYRTRVTELSREYPHQRVLSEYLQCINEAATKDAN